MFCHYLNVILMFIRILFHPSSGEVFAIHKAWLYIYFLSFQNSGSPKDDSVMKARSGSPSQQVPRISVESSEESEKGKNNALVLFVSLENNGDWIQQIFFIPNMEMVV